MGESAYYGLQTETVMNHPESVLQKDCVAWFRLQYHSLLRLLFAVPNGGRRNAREAAIMKAEGVMPGVADMILLVPSGDFHALCIEFKTGKGRQTELQKQWQQDAERYGNRYVVCRSFDEFREQIKNYLSDARMGN